MYCPAGGKHVVKLLVGNKTDRIEDRAVATRDGEAWARAHGCLFLEASAKSEDNVASCFEEESRIL
jgi:Ras-related protein Rab-18